MTIDEAINTLADSDPIVKLLQQVKQGRMRPDDAGLRAITESWLETYQRVLKSLKISDGVRRLDPAPRLAVLEEAGVLPPGHAAAAATRAAFHNALRSAG